MVGAGGKQRTDSTHVASAVRDLNRLELAGESVRACLEALAAAAPDWLASVIEVSEWSTRYGARVDSWRLPTSATKRERLAQLYGGDALALLRAIHADDGATLAARAARGAGLAHHADPELLHPHQRAGTGGDQQAGAGETRASACPSPAQLAL